MYTAKGKTTPRKLGRDLFSALLQLWCEQNAEYAALTTRFKEQQRAVRHTGRPHLLVSNIADWQNTRPALTPTEMNWIAMQPHVKVLMFMLHVFVLMLQHIRLQSFSRLQYAGYEIRTERSQSSNVTDNSKVRVPMIGSRGRLEQFYGSVKAISLTRRGLEGLSCASWKSNGSSTMVLAQSQAIRWLGPQERKDPHWTGTL